MTDQKSESAVDISIGDNNVQVRGSEDFVSKELSNILDKVDLTVQRRTNGSGNHQQETPNITDLEDQDSNTTLEAGSIPDGVDPQLAEIADSLNVDIEALSEHFFLEDGEVHIQDPRNIDPKYALIGYCIVREELTGEMYHDYNETKTQLIDGERVNIEEWGSTFLYRLRQSGFIRDDPNSQKSRNRPFKITPGGHEEFADWLDEDN